MALELTPAIEQEVKDEVIQLLEEKLGLTPAQVKAYYDKSEGENPDFNPTERRDDVVGKFEHGWRIGEIGPRKFGGAIDDAWPFIKPFVEGIVDKTITAAGKDI